MKKLLLLLLMGIQATSYACNLCIGHDGQRRLRQYAPEFVKCDCNCYEQGISKHVDGHRCITCGHRVLPYRLKDKSKTPISSKQSTFINNWKQNKLKRYAQKNENQSKLNKRFLVDAIG